MFHFLHGYSPKLWAEYVKNELVGPEGGRQEYLESIVNQILFR